MCGTQKKPIRLLFLLPTYTFGGAERTSLNLLSGMNTERFRVTLVTSRTVFPHFRNIDLEAFLPIENLGISVWFTKPGTFIRDIRRIALLLQHVQPEMSFGMMHYPSSLLVFARKLSRLKSKVVVSPRGPSVEYLKHFEKSLLRKFCLQYIFRFFCRHADGIIVASSGMQEECIRHYGARPDRVRVIPNSVELLDARFSGEKKVHLNGPGSDLIITTAGRLEKEKNIPFLLHAFRKIRDVRQCKLVVIGNGNEKPHLEEIVRNLHLENEVLFTGYLENPFDTIRQSDIFVHACLFEGFANAIIEAMACSVPVVSMDCPHGPRDIITHMKNGFLTPIDDETMLVNTVLRLIDDSELRKTIGEKGYQRAQEFPCTKMVQDYEDFFEKIMYMK